MHVTSRRPCWWFLVYSVFTHVASIYANLLEYLHKKRVQLPRDWFGTPTGPPFYRFGTPTWPPWRHVKILYWPPPLLPCHVAPNQESNHQCATFFLFACADVITSNHKGRRKNGKVCYEVILANQKGNSLFPHEYCDSHDAKINDNYENRLKIFTSPLIASLSSK